MKRIILIGSVDAGKTTLGQVLLKQKRQYKKTQMIEVLDSVVIDTPGEYTDRAQMWGALIVSAADADVIALVQSALDESSMLPPGYAGAFAKPVIGIVTKQDLADERQISQAADKLKSAGAERCFVLSSCTHEGVKELMEYLEN